MTMYQHFLRVCTHHRVIMACCAPRSPPNQSKPRAIVAYTPLRPACKRSLQFQCAACVSKTRIMLRLT